VTPSATSPGKRVLLPEGKPLHYRGQRRSSQGYLYRSTEAQCQGVHRKSLYSRSISEIVCSLAGASATDSSALAGTPAYKQSQRARYKIEALFAELKQQMSLRRVRLRRTWNVAEQFLLAATAQNLKRMVRFLAQREASALSTA